MHQQITITKAETHVLVIKLGELFDWNGTRGGGAAGSLNYYRGCVLFITVFA